MTDLARALPVLMLALAGFPALAAAGEDSDWPCVQRLVPEISAGMVWAGPPLDKASGWRDDADVAGIAPRLAKRVMPLDEAEREIEALADGRGADKDRKLTLLFAGIFENINDERTKVIAGIMRFTQRQKQLAGRIETQLGELDTQPSSQGAEQDARRADLIERNHWDSRIYEQREASLTYLCETPVLLEQRLFALGRAIQYHLD